MSGKSKREPMHHTTPGAGSSTCGTYSAILSGAHRITDDVDAVTCKRCLWALARVVERVELERDRRGDSRPAVLDGPGQSDIGADGAVAIARSLAGEPVTTGPRWGGIASAWEALVRAQAERRSIASASSPDRFGQRGGSGSSPTPTTPRETQTDLVDVEMARDASCRPMTIGEHELTAGQVLAIAQARIVGRIIRRPVRMVGGTVVEKRGVTCEIVAVTAQEVADETGLTRHQVGMVVRRVRAEMAPRLARKGLIPASVAARETGAEDEKQEDVMPAGFDLDGWKQISAHMRMSEDACRRLASRDDDPLPVRRLRGLPRVFANKADLDAWEKRQVVEYGAA